MRGLRIPPFFVLDPKLKAISVCAKSVYIEDRFEQKVTVLSPNEGRSTGEALIHQDSEAPPVDWFIVRHVFYHLWRYVVVSAT